MRQRAGLIVPLFSLRGQEGIGTIGDLPAFAAFASELGFSMLGLLPLQRLFGGETSPYGADSAFALDPMYLELAALPELRDNVLDRELSTSTMQASRELARCPMVLYADVRRFKEQAFEVAFDRFDQHEWHQSSERAAAFERFREGTPWLRDVALFSALRDAHGGHGWTQWPQPLRDRHPQALADAETVHERRIRYHAWLQFVLLEQWTRARADISHLGISLFGDVPFGQGTESVDVWAHPGWFRRDASLGVPPDAFSATGQDWGLPPFDISPMRDGDVPFQFFRQRLRATRALYDEFRLDHVVGYFRQWLWQGMPPEGHFVPDEEAAQHALGRELLELFREEIDGVPPGMTRGGWAGESAIVAEDLGTIPPFVREALTDLGMAGYKVIPWERSDSEGLRDPRRYDRLSVATYSTHDTLPIGRWVEEMEPWERDELFRMAQVDPSADADTKLLKLFELLFSANSARAFVLASELIGDHTRINTPGTTGGHNWTWRLPCAPDGLRADPVHAARFSRVRELLERSGRAPGSAG